MELNAIHLRQEQSRAETLHHAEICVVTTALEGSFAFNLCHEHMQIINCFSSGPREWIVMVILLLFGY